MCGQSKVMILSLVLFSTTGCIISPPVNRTLSPPADTKWVTVEIKNPSPYTRPIPLTARYISYECMKTVISAANGKIVTRHTYNPIAIHMEQQVGDIWRTKVAMTGGGPCKWTLSAIELGIEYTDATHLGKDLVLGTGVGAWIAFDNAATANGQFKEVRGDLNISPKYYPYITEWNMGEKKKELSLFGKRSFLKLRAYNQNEIKFSPEIDESKIVRYVGIEKKVKGAHSKIVYPDGSVSSDNEIFPNFDRLDKMKLK